METIPPEKAAYGSWSSPITSDLIAAHPIRLGDVAVDGEALYWTEARPSEQGRAAIVHRATDGTVRDVIAAPFNARTLVHEYGGGALLVRDGVVYFTNLDPAQPHADQRLYRIAPDGGAPVPLTPKANARYADMDFDPVRQRLVAVRESHDETDGEPRNEIVAIAAAAAAPGEIAVLVSGADFYAAPRLSPDGTKLAWIAWHHPHMPWSESELWLAELAGDGAVASMERIAGGPGISVMQPNWAPDGTLYFVTDQSNWWNLARLRDGALDIVCARDAEFGQPLWQLGGSTYGFLSPDTIIAAYCEAGEWHLGRIELDSGQLNRLALPYCAFRAVHTMNGRIAAIAAARDEPETLVRIHVENLQVDPLRASFQVAPGLKPYFSAPRSIAFPTTGGQMAHAFFYPPANPLFNAPDGEKPPLIVMSHGGPTSATTSALSLSRQFWTSRGFAVVDVNYRGSTGYGRAYRFQLERQWGLADVEDCIAAAQCLVDQGAVDAERVGITGGSAGGYTTLCALTFQDYFKAGASHYGIGDLEALARDTHKFESRYLEWLIGPYPRDRAIYIARSPVHHVANLNAPAAFFQGAQDKVVPPQQADAMVATLREKGCAVAYLLFEDEQHGFRKSANIKRALDAELLFFSMWLSRSQLRFFG